MKIAAMFALLALALTACKEEDRVRAYTVPKAPPASASAALPANHPAVAGGPAMTMANQATPGMVADAEAFPTPPWQAPASWRAQPPTPMRKGDWKLGPAAAEATCTVTVFPGDVGGLAANVNRWAGQIGLPPMTAAQVENLAKPVVVAGATATVRVALENDGRAIRAVSASHGGGTWFFKLSGPATTVNAASADFEAFIASVKFAAATK